MDNTNQSKEENSQAPPPEVLKPRDEDALSSPAVGGESQPKPAASPPRPKRGTYRPSHKATFIALAVVVAVLAVNAAIITFVLKGGSAGKNGGPEGEVTISQSALESVGVNRSPIGDSGVELTVNPNARFKGRLNVGGDVSVAGQFRLNSKFVAQEASLTQLEAGKTALSELNVNGDTTLSNLNLRSNLQVNGSTRLQGAVTVSQLMTVNNNMNVSGNLAVGGVLSANGLSIRALSVENSFSVGGHVVTRGAAPGVSSGSAVGSNGTVSISGNDIAGTVAVNAGTGAGGGVLANVTFRNRYSGTPRVVVTPIGGPVGNFYVNRSANGFSIVTSSALAPGGYAFDFIVAQ